MLNLSFTHRNNRAGQKFLETLMQNFGPVEVSTIFIKDISYMKINITGADDYPQRWLNAPQGILNCINSEITWRIMELNGINYGIKSSDRITKYYEILIFDMAAVSIKVRGGEQGSQSKYIKESECGKIVEIARRAIYVLGLDYGLVTLVMTGKRKPRVLHIIESPEARKKELQVIINIIRSIREIPRSAAEANQEVVLGADPEFMIFNSKSGKMIPASNFFPREGMVGCDNIRMPNRQQRPIVEIRPFPSPSPQQLMVNIRQGLVKAYKMAPYHNVRWIAGSQPISGYSIGGHIHFSNINLNYALLRALDNYLGITIFMIENPLSASGRRKKYGNLADIRLKDYGGFEYRTPGSWLVSPQITCAVLCLAKIVAENYPKLTGNRLNKVEAVQAFYTGEQEYFRTEFACIWEEITQIGCYDKYQTELEILPYMVFNHITWDEHSDIKTTWKLAGITKKNYNSNHGSRRNGSSGQISRSNSIETNGHASRLIVVSDQVRNVRFIR